MYVCTYVCMCVCMYVHTYVCMHACMYVCMHVHVCMNTVSEALCSKKGWMAKGTALLSKGKKTDEKLKADRQCLSVIHQKAATLGKPGWPNKACIHKHIYQDLQ